MTQFLTDDATNTLNRLRMRETLPKHPHPYAIADSQTLTPANRSYKDDLTLSKR